LADSVRQEQTEKYVRKRRLNAGGVSAKGHDRIQFDFNLDGVRYRPSVKRTPTEANLQRALERLEDIRERIRAGTFRFEEEFPHFRYMDRVLDPSQIRTCNQVFDQFIKHCEARLGRGDFAPITLAGYRKILDRIWRPRIGDNFIAIILSSRILLSDSGAVAWLARTVLGLTHSDPGCGALHRGHSLRLGRSARQLR
jgi:hypothetical protein